MFSNQSAERRMGARGGVETSIRRVAALGIVRGNARRWQSPIVRGNAAAVVSRRYPRAMRFLNPPPLLQLRSFGNRAGCAIALADARSGPRVCLIEDRIG